MNSVFTEYIRALGAAGSEGVARQTPDREQCLEVWARLRSLLVGELRKRSLWHVPPAFLGVYGGSNWSQEAALEELLAECYVFIFIRRLQALHAQLHSKANLDGLVLLNVRHFLYDTQKKHDPLGFRIFVVARLAVLQCLRDGTLMVLEGGPKVGNATVLGSVSVADLEKGECIDFETRIQHWIDDLMPDLVTARGCMLAPVQQKLGARLVVRCRDYGEAFRFKDLADAMKHDARRRWSALWQFEEGDTAPQLGEQGEATLVRLALPDLSLEERQNFERLTACVNEAICRLPNRVKTRAYLRRLWAFEHKRCITAKVDPTPSHRKLGVLLGIPRHRLPGLYKTLGRLLNACQQENFRTTHGSSEASSNRG